MGDEMRQLDGTPPKARCEHCGAEAVLATELTSLGSEPKHLIYQCGSCNRFTWTTRHVQQQPVHPTH